MSDDSSHSGTQTLGAVSRPLYPFSTYDGAQLVCIRGPGIGAVLPLTDQPVVVGSSKACDLRLNDPRVSRRHLQATYDGHAVEIVDLDSKNGCFYRGERFERREFAFGDELAVGKSTFKVVPAARELHPKESESSSFGQLVGASPCFP